VGHLGDQHLGEPEVPPTPVRGFLPGQRHLSGHPTPLPLGRDAGGGVRGPYRRVQVDGDPGLRCSSSRLEPFEGADLVDPLGVRHVPVEPTQLEDPVIDRTGIQQRIRWVGPGSSYRICPRRVRFPAAGEWRDAT
jgi:hypothetical protein